jgi:signal transduction histidine kinase
MTRTAQGGRRRAATSLRATITAGVALVGVLAFVAGVLLVTVTARLRVAGEQVAASVRSVRLLDEAEVELLLHARTEDATVRSAHAAELRRSMGAVAEQAMSVAEAEAFARARDAAERYLAHPSSVGDGAPEALSGAFVSIETLRDTQLEQWREATRRARRADQLASGVGAATMLVVLPVVVGFVWWTWRRAFRPLFELEATLERFASGQRDARAAVAGPQELRAMAERFNAMASELSRQRDAQNAFLAGVAHDLRTPLSPLWLAANALANPRHGTEGQDGGALLATISRQVRQLDRMVGDLFAVARIDLGRLELSVERVDLRRLAGEVVELFRVAAPRHDLRLRAPQDAVWLACDPLRVQQVLNNLVSNAVKYSPEGGQIVVAVTSGAESASVSVRDFGSGVSDEDRRRLFEPFSRGRSAAVAGIPGSGLGLFVARRIVEAHGGTLALHGGGPGATFVVSLPRGPAQAEAVESPAAGAAGSTARLELPPRRAAPILEHAHEEPAEARRSASEPRGRIRDACRVALPPPSGPQG